MKLTGFNGTNLDWIRLYQICPKLAAQTLKKNRIISRKSIGLMKGALQNADTMCGCYPFGNTLHWHFL